MDIFLYSFLDIIKLSPTLSSFAFIFIKKFYKKNNRKNLINMKTFKRCSIQIKIVQHLGTGLHTYVLL